MTFNDLDETLHAHMMILDLRAMDVERLKSGLDLMSTISAESRNTISSLESRIVELGSEYEELKQIHRVKLLKYQALIDSFDNVANASKAFSSAVNKELVVVDEINTSATIEKANSTESNSIGGGSSSLGAGLIGKIDLGFVCVFGC